LLFGASHVIQQGDGITAGSYDLTGMMPGQEGTPLYMLSGRCLGQFSIINGNYSETGSCQFSNAAGDKCTPARAIRQRLKELGTLCKERGS
jgi:hypothetical protein